MIFVPGGPAGPLFLWLSRNERRWGGKAARRAGRRRRPWGGEDFRFMDDIDITTIFSNLLENALSASALCKTNKEVSVIVSSHNNFVIINVKNSCNSYTKCGTFSSKDYGTGLYNVENSVKKYEGFLKISYSQTEFNCNVVLSNTH